jgi:hypothetical protein
VVPHDREPIVAAFPGVTGVQGAAVVEGQVELFHRHRASLPTGG